MIILARIIIIIFFLQQSNKPKCLRNNPANPANISAHPQI
jgi:hypothetical protein